MTGVRGLVVEGRSYRNVRKKERKIRSQHVPTPFLFLSFSLSLFFFFF